MTGTRSKRNLPRELWQEILSRFSVEPILQFRCVSKTWRSMIDDPNFCHLHLRRFSNNRQQTHLLVLEERVLTEGPFPFKWIKTFNLLTDSSLHNSYFTVPIHQNRRDWIPVSAMDGVVMLVHDERGVFYPSSTPRLLLWNPTIRKSRILPPSPRLPLRMRYFDIGFGFDPSINDYKHVRIAHLYEDGSPQFVAIYTVGLGSWKTIPFQSKSCLICPWVDYRFGTPCRSRGYLISIARNLYSMEDELVWFDLSNEVFSCTPLPVAEVGFKHLTVVNDKCLFVQQTIRGGSAWTLESSETDSDSMHWTKRYSINVTNETRTLLPSTLETEEMLHNELHERVIRNIIDPISATVRLFDYSESLVLLK